MIYSMWSGYKDFSAVKEMLDCCKTVKDVHVSGHITKEDLERVIKVVAPEKLIIHHTPADMTGQTLEVPESIEKLNLEDGEIVVL